MHRSRKSSLLYLVTQTVYEESVSHLRELLHQTGTVLNGFVEHNMTYLHMRSISIQEIDEDENIQQYLEKAKEETGYTRFYFLSREGRYITPDGVTGNLGLEGSPADPIKNNEDFIMKAVLPGQSQHGSKGKGAGLSGEDSGFRGPSHVSHQ